MAFDKYKYINAYNKQKYDRLTLILPKGSKDILKQAAAAAGMSASEYVGYLLKVEKERQNVKKSTESDKLKLLKKWQIARRYYDMIENVIVSTDEKRAQAAAAGKRIAGCEYTIIFKEGFINDLTGRQFTTNKMHEIRRIMPHTHKV